MTLQMERTIKDQQMDDLANGKHQEHTKNPWIIQFQIVQSNFKALILIQKNITWNSLDLV